MSNERKGTSGSIFFLVIGAIILFIIIGVKNWGSDKDIHLTSSKMSNAKTTIYFSKDSLFSISLPHVFTHYNYSDIVGHRFLAFINEGDKETISIMKEQKMAKADFYSSVESQCEKVHTTFAITTKLKNDSIVHKRITSGLFSAHEYYFFKNGVANDYIIKIASSTMNLKEASAIASSLKEHNRTK